MWVKNNPRSDHDILTLEGNFNPNLYSMMLGALLHLFIILMSLSLKKPSESSDVTDQATNIFMYIYVSLYHILLKATSDHTIFYIFFFRSQKLWCLNFMKIKLVKANKNSATLTEVILSKE